MFRASERHRCGDGSAQGDKKTSLPPCVPRKTGSYCYFDGRLQVPRPDDHRGGHPIYTRSDRYTPPPEPTHGLQDVVCILAVEATPRKHEDYGLPVLASDS